MATVVTPTNSSTPSRQATDLNLDVGLERDWSPIRKTRREHNRLTPRDWSPCRRTSELSRFRSDWSPHRRSSNPATPTLSREWSPVRRGSSVVNTSPFGSPRSKAEAFASLKRTPEQMVKQADRLIERTHAIMERSAEAKRRTEDLLKASRERRAQERLDELASYEGPNKTNSEINIPNGTNARLQSDSNGNQVNDI